MIRVCFVFKGILFYKLTMPFCFQFIDFWSARYNLLMQMCAIFSYTCNLTPLGYKQTLKIRPKVHMRPNFGFLFNRTKPVFSKVWFLLSQNRNWLKKFGFNRNLTEFLPLLILVFLRLKILKLK